MMFLNMKLNIMCNFLTFKYGIAGLAKEITSNKLKGKNEIYITRSRLGLHKSITKIICQGCVHVRRHKQCVRPAGGTGGHQWKRGACWKLPPDEQHRRRRVPDGEEAISSGAIVRRANGDMWLGTWGRGTLSKASVVGNCERVVESLLLKRYVKYKS